MSTMRQRLLSMARRVQERPCWSHDDATCESHTIEHTVGLPFWLQHQCHMTLNPGYSQSTLDDPDENESIYRQTSIVDVGCFKYFLDDRVHIQFSNGFLVEMTPDQVHSCQVIISTAVTSRSISTSSTSSIPTRTFDVESQIDESTPRSTYSTVHHRRSATSSKSTASTTADVTSPF